MKSRSKGEGSIWRKASGLWVGTVEVGRDSTGRRQRRCVTGATKTEVQGKLLELRNSKSRGQLPASSRLTVGEYLTSWLATKEAEIEPSAHYEYSARVRRLIQPTALARRRLQDVRPLDVDSWLSELRARGVSASSQTDARRVLAAALQHAVNRDLLPANPVRRVKAPKTPAPKRPWITGEQTRQLLAAVADASPKARAFVTLLLLSGVRFQEAAALRWSCIDWKKGTVRVERALAEVGSKLIEKEPKTPAARREIAVSALVLDALRAHRGQAGVLPLPTNLVFTNSVGKPYRRANALRQLWWPALKAAGIAQLGFHSARRGHVSALVANGGDLRAVSARVGHTKVAFTLQTYAQTSAEADRRLAQLSTELVAAGQRA